MYSSSEQNINGIPILSSRELQNDSEKVDLENQEKDFPIENANSRFPQKETESIPIIEKEKNDYVKIDESYAFKVN